MNKILIIDDDADLTDLLSEYLQQQGFSTDVENLPNAGINKLREHSFDILLLDVMMPEIDGFAALAEIRKFSKIPVIMLTARGDDYDKILGLELGADDYLPKPFNHRELVARIKALIRRVDPKGMLADNDVIDLHGLRINVSNQVIQYKDKVVETTGTEFQLLVHLVNHAGRLQSKQVLCEKVLGRKLSPFDRSLDMHISNLRKKIAEYGVKDVIKTVRGNGYMISVS
ncbi:response regulator [Agaribacter marinus]|uniref:DNA-binding response regulator n=1 Tax=Agaribacter marinus TaxID=1431249 RepID=A0AA37T1T5_9ALTE|nr:response regulator [Agaribacter marinus]GLR72330.1 DNA-binding response regulator [Agaribacter marinus]